MKPLGPPVDDPTSFIWTRGDIDSILIDLTLSKTEIQSQTQLMVDQIDLAISINQALFFIVLILGINLGYKISPYFLPRYSDIGV